MVTPRVISLPGKGSDLKGWETVELCAEAGLVLDDFQSYVIVESMRENADKWAYFEAGVNMPRQNGKGAIIEARIIGELYVVKSRLTIYSAHNFDTSLEHFRRIQFLVEETPKLAKELTGEKGARKYGVTFGHGKEGIELKGDRRLRFRTRTKGGGRGFSCDLLFLDEAMILPESMHGALLPTLSARPNAQVWYAGSAVDQEVHEDGVVFARVRKRGIKGDDDLAYFEWSVGNGQPDDDHPEEIPEKTYTDQAAWAQANPALGIRISPEFINLERRSMDRRTFAVERLGIGDWPRTDHVASNPIDMDTWLELADLKTKLLDPACIAFDVSPDRRSSISAAGKNQAGLWHIECIDSRPGTGWVAERIAKIVKEQKPALVVCDGVGPAASLIPALLELDVEVETLNAQEHAQACGRLVDVVEQGILRHLDDEKITGALRMAKTRPLGDAWAWSRRNSSVNISPLVSSTLALSAAMTQEKPRKTAYAWA
jgi:hypothetical protein